MDDAWPIIGASEAAEYLGVERRNLTKRIAPVMQIFKAAYQAAPEKAWQFNPKRLPQWKAFLAYRHQMIESGEWKPKRKYSTADFGNWLQNQP